MKLVADNLHALNPVVAEALERLDPAPLQELACRCERAGARIIDLNPGYLSRRKQDRMVFMVEAVQEVVSARLMLDSPDPEVLAKGLSVCRETPILNALSLEEHKLEGILPLASEHQTELVVLLLDERSFTPSTLEEKIALAIELRARAMEAGLAQDALIFDPVLPNLGWNEASNLVSVAMVTVRMIATGSIFGEPARTIAGLSNLRSGLRNRYPGPVETACLDLFAGAGLDHVLANVLDPVMVDAYARIVPFLASK